MHSAFKLPRFYHKLFFGSINFTNAPPLPTPFLQLFPGNYDLYRTRHLKLLPEPQHVQESILLIFIEIFPGRGVWNTCTNLSDHRQSQNVRAHRRNVSVHRFFRTLFRGSRTELNLAPEISEYVLYQMATHGDVRFKKCLQSILMHHSMYTSAKFNSYRIFSQYYQQKHTAN